MKFLSGLFSSLCFLLFFLSVKQQTWAQTRPLIELEVGSVAGAPGDTVCIPVTVKNFSRVVSANFGVFAQDLYGEVISVDYHPALLAEGDVGLFPKPSRPGFSEFLFQIFEGEGRSISLPDDAILFEYCMVIESYHGGNPFNFGNPVYITQEVDLYPQIEVLTEVNSRQDAFLHFISGKVNIVNRPEQVRLDISLNSEFTCGEELLTIEADSKGGQRPYTYLVGTYPGYSPEVRFTTRDSVFQIGKEWLTHGVYQVAVMDANEQFAVSHFYYYGGNDGLTGTGQGLPVPSRPYTIIKNPTCENGGRNGSIIIDEEEPLSYHWSTGARTATLNNLLPGTYELTVTNDESGCSAAFSYDLEASGSFLIEYQGATAYCPQDSVEVGFTNLDDYSDIRFQWETGDTSAMVRLPSGDYRVTITNQVCEEVRSVNIPYERESVSLDRTQFGVVKEYYTCASNVARIGVVPVDSTAEYEISWSHDPTLRDAVIEVTDLFGEVYVTITSPGQCPMRTFFFLAEPRFDFAVAAYQQYTNCTSDTFNLGFNLVGPVADSTQLSYRWSSGDTTRTVSLPGGGTLVGTVAYGDFCEQRFSFNNNLRPRLEVDIKRDTFRCLEETAEIGVLNSEVYPNRQYFWSTGDTTPIITVQEPKGYTLTVAEGACRSTYVVPVPLRTQPNPIDTSLFEEINTGLLTCQDTLVRVGLRARGDLAPYTFAWSHDETLTTPEIDVAKPGRYTLKVFQDEGCPSIKEFFIDPPVVADSLFPFSVVTDVDCRTNQVDIGLAFTASVDTGLYRYAWQNGDSTRYILGDRNAQYFLEVEYGDNDLCKKSYSISTYSQADFAPELELKRDTQNCEDNRVTIGVLGAEKYPDMTFQWSNGATTPLTEVYYGNYRLTLTDGFCARVETFIVPFLPDEDGLSGEDFEIVQGEFTCFEETVTIGVRELNPSTRNHYSWHHDEYLLDSLIQIDEPGEYQLMVTKAGGCPVPLTFEVMPPVFPFETERIEEYQGCTADSFQLGAIVSEATNVQYSWSNGATTNQIEVPAGQTYDLAVNYGVNRYCSEEFTFYTETQRPQTTIIREDCNIAGDCEASFWIEVQTEFTEGPIQYLWSDGTSRTVSSESTVFNFSEQAEPLDLIVRDAVGCTDTIREIYTVCELDDRTIQDNYFYQYIECEPDSLATDQLNAVVYTEVVPNFAIVPPYDFEWTNGYQENSYFRSGLPLSALDIIGTTVKDQSGRTFNQGFGEAEYYGCGNIESPKFLAPSIIVEPGHSFAYPVHVVDHENLKEGVFTVKWDPCLLGIDSMRFIRNNGDEDFLAPGEFFESGLSEVDFVAPEDNRTNDSTLIAVLYFTARAEMTGVSPFLFGLNMKPQFFDDQPDNGIIPVHGSITVAHPDDLVNPGDTDKDGTVSHKDILNIGLGYAAQGPDRRSVDVSRQAFGYSWREELPRSQTNYKNIDCDGDGNISPVDLVAIQQNWDYAQPLRPGEITFGAPELFIRRDTLDAASAQRVPVELGLFFDAVDRIHGLAFSIAYDPNVVDEQSLTFEWGESWFLTDETPLSLIRIDTQLHLMRIALTNTDQINRTGYGPIGHLNFTVKDGAEEVTFEFGDILAVDAQEQISPVNGSTSTLFIRNISTNTERVALAQEIRLYPQPTDGWLYLDYPAGRVQSYTISDLSGKTLLQTPSIEPRINLSGLPAGMYLLHLRTDSGLITKKLVKASRF